MRNLSYYIWYGDKNGATNQPPLTNTKTKLDLTKFLLEIFTNPMNSSIITAKILTLSELCNTCSKEKT